ncbi:dephospho-CoA kinase [Alkalilacustris brevis]|uniref:dephospho-CoA kinase n=1 Tax=Alkalilacustris brevis TaxID=2026338 RepID=UPI000E0CE527|nr:dephospho-CoA kinase [Alkalilacustris brevis]
MSRPFILGLTGSIGMGKTTTAQMFREAGLPVWDADATVHRLYSAGAEGTRAIAKLCPQAVGPEGVDRAVLKAAIAAEPELLRKVEAAIHPLVAADRAAFIARAASEGHDIIVLDVPLLFETGLDAQADAAVVVSAPPEVQRERVLARPGMTAQAFEQLLARQMPDAEKRARATHVIETRDMESTRAAVRAVIARIRSQRDA